MIRMNLRQSGSLLLALVLVSGVGVMARAEAAPVPVYYDMPGVTVGGGFIIWQPLPDDNLSADAWSIEIESGSGISFVGSTVSLPTSESGPSEEPVAYYEFTTTKTGTYNVTFSNESQIEVFAVTVRYEFGLAGDLVLSDDSVTISQGSAPATVTATVTARSPCPPKGADLSQVTCPAVVYQVGYQRVDFEVDAPLSIIGGSTVVTDGSGRASVEISVAGATETTLADVRASLNGQPVSGSPAQLQVIVHNRPTMTASLSLSGTEILWASNPCGGPGTTRTQTATVTVVDASGRPVAGQPVDFEADSALSLDASRVYTDDSGRASVTVSPGAYGPYDSGFANVRASIGGLPAAGSPAELHYSSLINFRPPPPWPQLSVVATNGGTVQADGRSAYTVQVSMINACGQVESGGEVAFTVTGSARLSQATAVIDEDGWARVTLTDTVPETVTVSAAMPGSPYGRVYDSPVEVRFEPIPWQANLSLTDDTVAVQRGSSSTTVEARVAISRAGPCRNDSAGNIGCPLIAEILVGKQVYFEVDAPLVIDGPSTVLTDETGVASVAISAPSATVSTTANVRAYVDGQPVSGSPAQLNVAVTSPEQLNAAIILAPASAEVFADGRDAWNATIIVTDGQGGPVVGLASRFGFQVASPRCLEAAAKCVGQDPQSVVVSEVSDKRDGSYAVRFTSTVAGQYVVQANLLDESGSVIRELANSPLTVVFTTVPTLSAPVIVNVDLFDISGTVEAPLGSVVRIFNQSGRLVCSAGVAADGTWACAPGQDQWEPGDITAIAYDPSGKVSSSPGFGNLFDIPYTSWFMAEPVPVGVTFSESTTGRISIEPAEGISIISRVADPDSPGSTIYTFKTVKPGSYMITNTYLRSIVAQGLTVADPGPSPTASPTVTGAPTGTPTVPPTSSPTSTPSVAVTAPPDWGIGDPTGTPTHATTSAPTAPPTAPTAPPTAPTAPPTVPTAPPTVPTSTITVPTGGTIQPVWPILPIVGCLIGGVLIHRRTKWKLML